MDVREMDSLAFVIVVATFIITVGSTMLGSLQQNAYSETATCNATSGIYTGCSVAWNVTSLGSGGIATMASWLPLISLVVVLSIVIGVIVNYMGRSTGL